MFQFFLDHFSSINSYDDTRYHLMDIYIYIYTQNMLKIFIK